MSSVLPLSTTSTSSAQATDARHASMFAASLRVMTVTDTGVTVGDYSRGGTAGSAGSTGSGVQSALAASEPAEPVEPAELTRYCAIFCTAFSEMSARL